MCGIITAFNYGDNKEPVNEWIKNQLQDQFHRGSKGFEPAWNADDGGYELACSCGDFHLSGSNGCSA